MQQQTRNTGYPCTLICAVLLVLLSNGVSGQKQYSKARKLELREDVRRMFQHAYDGYLRHASNYDELRPLTCDGHDTWGSYSLTLIDALDTLATMGNFTEFRRAARLLEEKMDFDRDINVSVFETNIRIVGGLLSAHLLSKRAGVELEPGWPCKGPLLRLAEDVARRLLPAFVTNTGMPYGTVNLRYGVPKGETSITCTAGVGTFLIDAGTYALSAISLFFGVFKNRPGLIIPWLVVEFLLMIGLGALVFMLRDTKIVQLLGGQVPYFIICYILICMDYCKWYVMHSFYQSLRTMNKLREIATVAIPCPAPGAIPYRFQREHMYLGSNGYKHILTESPDGQC